ncbi:putative GPI anchored cell wall protein [Aspergillus undulatus]|uniref:putative GPI anchored cell wall protein n=1 Tax=Aspergillus undulatus TaxID=1810928 RepID=UPI003CCDFE8D
MLFAKSTALFTLFVLGKVVAAAGTGTPACLLTVVGPETPGDLKALCKTNAKEIQSSIKDECGDEAKDALKYYSSVCEDAGFEVDTGSSTLTSTSSHSSTKTSDSDSESTSTHSGSATTSSGASSTSDLDSDSGSESSSGSGSDTESASTSESADDPTPTNGASSDKQVSAAAFAAVVFVGFAATL